LKKNKLDIFKTFDIFNSEAIGVLKNEIIKFVLIETDNFFSSKSCIKTDIGINDSVQISVINNKKLYNLLTNSWRKYKQKIKNESM